MAESETLRSQSDGLNEFSRSQSPASSSEPSLSRNLSSIGLNAGAREFVPVRAPPQPQPLGVMIPPPPPPAMLHMYHAQPPFRFPIQGPVPILPHMVPMQNHHIHNLPHRQKGHVNHHQFELVEKKGDHDRRKDQKKDHGSGGAADGATDSINGLSDEAVLKIVNQVEYYISDLNLATTDHLMRFINKDPEGYVPISVVASFKKIKALISSNSQLATVLRKSSKLVVSEDGTKVRRQHPITVSDIEELQSRIVVAENLPEDHCYQNLKKIFSAIGSVKNIRTCQPQNSGSGASSASRSSKHEGTLFSNKVHAFVEYETVNLAEKAVTEFNKEENWRSGLRVRLMLKHQQTKDSKHGHGRGRKGHDAELHHEEDCATTSEQLTNEKPSEDCPEEWDAYIQEHTGEEVGIDKAGWHRKGQNKGRGKGHGRGLHHNNRVNHQEGTPPSDNIHVKITEQSTVAIKQPPGPRMPDGTRGFTMGRGKPVTVQGGEFAMVTNFAQAAYALELSSLVPAVSYPKATLKLPLGELSLQEKEEEKYRKLLIN